MKKNKYLNTFFLTFFSAAPSFPRQPQPKIDTNTVGNTGCNISHWSFHFGQTVLRKYWYLIPLYLLPSLRLRFKSFLSSRFLFFGFVSIQWEDEGLVVMVWPQKCCDLLHGRNRSSEVSGIYFSQPFHFKLNLFLDQKCFTNIKWGIKKVLRMWVWEE